MSTIAYRSAPPSLGWLRNRAFDMSFLVGLPLLALGSGAVVLLEPRLLLPVLLADLWLLGYHHVISTFTRLCFDAASLERYRFLIFALPPIVVAGCVGAVVATSSMWLLVSVYFYWQWFHYTRQSWGIAQSYRRKTGDAPPPSAFDSVAFYAIPVAGVLLRSAQDPDQFLMLPIRMIPVPLPLAEAAAAAAFALVVVWWARALMEYRNGRLSAPTLMYLAAHHAIFAVAYVFIRDVTIGWLVVNIWHNGQYVLFVWMFNNRRFAAGPSAKARLLSWLSQNGRLWWYLAFCVALSTAIYGALANVVPLVMAMPVFVLYQVINFHHYVVDAVIWRRGHVQQALRDV
jgi:hypothetical protein